MKKYIIPILSIIGLSGCVCSDEDFYHNHKNVNIYFNDNDTTYRVQSGSNIMKFVQKDNKLVYFTVEGIKKYTVTFDSDSSKFMEGEVIFKEVKDIAEQKRAKKIQKDLEKEIIQRDSTINKALDSF